MARIEIFGARIATALLIPKNHARIPTPIGINSVHWGARPMPRSFVYGTVRDSQRTVIYSIRVKDATIDPIEADAIAERMREKIQSRGDFAADVVVIEGDSKETLRLYGLPYSVGRVRAAMFNAAINWKPIELG
jgi:hypothetical protein